MKVRSRAKFTYDIKYERTRQNRGEIFCEKCFSEIIFGCSIIIFKIGFYRKNSILANSMNQKSACYP
jgi:hypothetical protein